MWYKKQLSPSSTLARAQKMCKFTAHLSIERFFIECRKTKVITLANHKANRQSNEPIKSPSKDM